MIKSGLLGMTHIHNLSMVMSLSVIHKLQKINSNCVLIMNCMFECYICGMWKMENNLEKSEKFALTHEGEWYWQIMAFFSLDLFIQRLYFYYPPISIVIYAVNTVLWNNCFIFCNRFSVIHDLLIYCSWSCVYINILSLNTFSSPCFLCSETSYQH